MSAGGNARLRGRWPAGGLLTVLLLGGVAVPALADNRDVRVGTYYFEDASSGDGRVDIDAGDSITFTFYESTSHTATVSGMFDSGQRSGGETYTTGALTRAGRYTLYCTVHGAGTHSTLLVIRSTAPPPSPTPTPAPAASPTRAPSPRPTATARPAPKPTPSATRAPSRAPTPPTQVSPAGDPAPSATTASSPSPAEAVTTSPATPSVEAAGPVVSTRPSLVGRPWSSPSAGTDRGGDAKAPDIAPASPLDDAGSGWLLPVAIVVGLLLVAAGAIALGRRRT